MSRADYLKSKYDRLTVSPTTLAQPMDLRHFSEFGKGFEAFKDESVGIGGGALALGAQQLKKIAPQVAQPYLDKAVEAGLETYGRKTEESVAGAQAPEIATIEEIKGVGDLGDWAAYQAGKGLPQLAGFGLGGVIGRQAAKLGVSRGLKHVLKTETGKKLAGREVTKEMKEEAANQVRKTLNRGTIAGGVGLAAPYEGGAAFGQMVKEGLTPEQAANEAAAVGGINAALEFLPLYEVAKKIGMGDFAKQGVREIIKNDKALARTAVELARRASGAAAVGATAEGLTEGLQELTNIAATRWARDQEIFADLSEDEWSAVLNAGAAGGLLGGGVAGAGGVFIGPQGAEAGAVDGTTPPKKPKAGPRPEPTQQPPQPGQPGPTEGPDFVGPPPELTGPVYPESERRRDAAVRKRVDEMSPTEQKAAIEYLRGERALSQATGISNKLAWEERTAKPFMAAIDVDSLKWINDNLGHEKGDELLKVVAKQLQEETGDAYHFSGDEFWVQGDSVEELQTLLTRAQEKLQAQDVGGYPPSFSFGIAENTEAAERAMMASKTEREKQGMRAGRGEEPPKIRIPPIGTPVEATPTAAPAPAPVDVVEETPTGALPNYAEPGKKGWQPTDARQYIERFSNVYAGSDPLSSTEGADAIQAANLTLPEEVARQDPKVARELAAEIRKSPGQFAVWSGMHPDFANKVANDLERAAAKAEDTGDFFVKPAPDLESNFGEVSTNAQGRPFESRRAASVSAQKLGMDNVAIDEIETEAGPRYVIRDLGPRETAATPEERRAPTPEFVGDVQMPVNLVEEAAVPPSTKITLTRQDGPRTLTKQVNARKAVALSKKRVDTLTKVIRCLST